MCVCVEGRAGGDGEGCNLSVCFVCQRLMSKVSCILNHDWLLLLSSTVCPGQIPQGVNCSS